MFDCRDAFAETLIDLVRADPRVRRRGQRLRRLDQGRASSSRQFPDRLVNVGIAEQNLVGVGAGPRQRRADPVRLRRRRRS